MRRSILVTAVGSVALACAACGSPQPTGVGTGSSTSATTTPRGTGATTSPAPVVITEATATETTIAVGGAVAVELASSSYGRDGHLVPWGRPSSSAPSVLAPSAPASTFACPTNATCTVFVGRSPGSATVSAVGPSGILCDANRSRCIAVAAVFRRFVVQVTSG